MYHSNDRHNSSKFFQGNEEDRKTFKKIISIVYSPFAIILGAAAFIA